MSAEGMRTKRAFWSDDTWVDENTCARKNPQRDRKYYHTSVTKDSVTEEPREPITLRTPGIMVHITVSAAQGGILFGPSFVLPGATFQRGDTFDLRNTQAMERKRLLKVTLD